MLTYVICFLLTIGIAYLVNSRNIRVDRIKINSILFLIMIFIPCYFAAVRGPEIGRDVSVYGDKLFAMANNYTSYFVFWKKSKIEPIFLLLAYVCSKYTNIYIYYFTIQFFTFFPIALLLNKEEYRRYLWIGITYYMFWIYPFSLNIMRQSIAISIIIYGYTFIRERNLKKYILCCIIAIGFHSTAILGLLLYIFNVLISIDPKKDKTFFRKFANKFKKINVLLIAMISLLCVIGCSQLITFFSAFNPRFEAQIIFLNTYGFEYIHVFFIAVFSGMLYYIQKRVSDHELFFLMFVIIIGAIIYQIKAYYSQMYRLSMFFVDYLVIALPYGLSLNKGKYKPIFVILILVISMIGFWYYIIYSRWHSVYPFVFR